MSDFTSSTQATILFDALPEMDFVNLINELKRPFRNIALEFDEIEVDETQYALFLNDRISLRIARGQVPVKAESLLEATRPAQTRTPEDELAALMHDYSDTLVITVADGDTRSVPERLRVSVCYHVIRHLLQHYEAALVHWHHTNTLFSADEFANPTDTRRPVMPRRPTGQAARHSARPEPVMPEARDRSAEGRDRFAEGYMGVAENHSRLDESFAQVVDPEHAVIHDAEEVKENQRSWRDILPNIAAPSEETLRKSRLAIFASDLIEIEDVKYEAPAKDADLMEQLTVYVMTVTMMVMLFPAGFAMMIYNILAGESLKMTSRAMALTGVGISLDYAGIAGTLIGAV